MTFRYPWLLLLLALVPLLVWLRYYLRFRATILYSDHRRLRNLPQGWSVLVFKTLPILYGLGLLCWILALARPQKGLAESQVREETVDIMLLVDVSTSMRAEDFSTVTRRVNRLDAAKQVLERFIAAREHDRLGMVAFSALPYSMSPLTLDHPWLLQQMQRLKTGMIEDGTAIGSAIGSAVNRLRNSKAKSKVVVLLTDGMNNAGKLSPLDAAQTAKALNIRVYTVGAGREGLVDMPVTDMFGQQRYIRQRSEIDEASLKQIADITGGKFFRADNLDKLQKVYEEIDALEKTEVEVHQYTRFEERFQPFLWMGLLLLLLEKILGETRFRRLP